MGDVQLHDFNPGITQNGLFWTAFAPRESVQVDLRAGTASLNVRNLHMKDYFDFENAVVGGGDSTAAGRRFLQSGVERRR